MSNIICTSIYPKRISSTKQYEIWVTNIYITIYTVRMYRAHFGKKSTERERGNTEMLMGVGKHTLEGMGCWDLGVLNRGLWLLSPVIQYLH